VKRRDGYFDENTARIAANTPLGLLCGPEGGAISPFAAAAAAGGGASAPAGCAGRALARPGAGVDGDVLRTEAGPEG